MRLPIILLSLLLPASASAVQGGAYRVLGAEDARGARVSHPEVQARLAETATWTAFVELHGDGWRARWDEATGAAIRVWGPGWAIDDGALADNVTAWPLAEDILFRRGLPLGLPAEGSLRRGLIDRSDGVTTVTWRRVHAGLEVVDARVSLRFKAGRFVMAQLDSMPGITVGSTPTQSADEAILQALAAVESPARPQGSPTLVVLPLPRAMDVTYRLAWRVIVEAPGSRRHVYVDASDGRFLRWDEQFRFLDGTIEVEIDDRSPVGGLTTRPLVFAEIEGDDGDAETDGLGAVTLPGSGSQTVSFAAGSDHFDIDSDTADASWSDDLAEGGTAIGVPSGGNATQIRRNRAQADAHVFAHEVREYALGINPQFRWANDRVPVRVNLNSWPNGDQVRCNAWFDGDSINFARQGSGCNNTARLQDVLYHEYGHGFHGYNIVEGAGGWGDGSLGEGIADYLSGTMNDDPALGVGFFTGSNQPLRRMDGDARWPEDRSDDPHVTGIIIASALWDVREALIDAHGRVAGVALADRYFWHIAMRASDIEDAYIEALLADDDNGDLDDGTPNQCLIDLAFGAHGLGPGVGPLDPVWTIGHTPSGTEEPAAEPIPVDAHVLLSNAQCAESDLGEVVLRWSSDPSVLADDFEALVMDPAGGQGQHAVDLPALPDGTFLRYYVTAFDDRGDPIGTLPRGSITDPWFGVWIGDPDVIFEADFEEDDGGFTHELLRGDAGSEGSDDWQWGPAGGRGGDPTSAHSGEFLWGNDISPQNNWNGEYQSDVVNVLRSGVIEVLDAESIHLQFQRWLTVEDAWFDQAEVLVNGQVVWGNLASDESTEEQPARQQHLDLEWAFRSYDITDLVDEGTVEIEWRLTTDAGLQFGGWNIDDVRVIGAALPRETGDDDDGDGDPLNGASFIAQGAGCSCDAADSGTSAWWALLLVASVRRRR